MRWSAILLLALLVLGCAPRCHGQEPVPESDTSTWCCDACREKFAALEARVKALEAMNFDGVGKAPAPTQTLPKATPGKYPLRATHWTGCDHWTHLANGQHAGKFDLDWLKSLSWSELQSLHADDHEGKVDWTKAKRAVPVMVSPKNNCPNGVCPKVRR